MDAYLERLGALPMFGGCTNKELRDIARIVDELQVESGRVLMSQGDAGQEAFVIEEGTAEVVRDGQLLATVGPGSYVGELALIDAGPRSATVTATTPMRVLVIGTREFSTLLDEVPGLARRVLVSTARRLRAANEGAHQPIH
ncbi:MAG: cyclic nucleotide-binding domain-containing protein [Candidatus Microthrix subdominans]|jgi:CRP/FNR family cyclic AMP-dependent transcriptional regulator|uniref:Cyclic nucleotide-binding domain-containing protein n=1 Tax=Candidatus Neomicrothrix subdominans TaxID=2954438 RepID=A0A936TDC6_9ACTN|nr:cyclic nucleotide-binding domain-containing protein [Candidatus Microthrix sp.]MBK6309201.1 cyclic nucleotide-binding domain-containing protein [Candidatus Microthrix sp.]MBK9297208.1 cyclic nucleotide-binding domain-containing protein [Candidatus Microthrix subdominans]MBK9561055.1 cyclic nucleotide-binding domain-containing protein [Candidatus Microthrix sp.]HMS46553.1 cyclic nucleotide-binding domain-containing protein [Candidatus Microthrix sp.]